MEKYLKITEDLSSVQCDIIVTTDYVIKYDPYIGGSSPSIIIDRNSDLVYTIGIDGRFDKRACKNKPLGQGWIALGSSESYLSHVLDHHPVYGDLLRIVTNRSFVENRDRIIEHSYLSHEFLEKIDLFFINGILDYRILSSNYLHQKKEYPLLYKKEFRDYSRNNDGAIIIYQIIAMNYLSKDLFLEKCLNIVRSVIYS